MSSALRLSLVGNLVLAAAATVLFIRRPAPTVVTVSQPALPNAATATAARTVPMPAPAAPKTPGRPITPDVIERLEQAGVPRRLLVDVLRLDHHLRWNKRVAALETKYAPRPVPQREYLSLERLRDEDQTRELKEALGEEGYLAWDKEETLRKVNFEEVPLDAAEADHVYRVQKNLEDKLRELQMAMEDGDADVADIGTLQMQAQDGYEAELQKLLGETRYNALKGYTFPLVDGTMMFNELSPSPEQVSALKQAQTEYQVQEAALAKRLRANPADTTAIAAELKALNDARDENFRKTVGAETYAQLQREHDTTYQTLQQFSSAWNLSETELSPVYDQLKALRGNVDQMIRAAEMTELAGHDADWNAINASVQQARKQTAAELEKLLGSDRVSRLKRNGLLSGTDPNSRPPARLDRG